MTGEMADKVAGLAPEMVMLTGACACLLIGLSRSVAARRATPWLAGLTLAVAGMFVLIDYGASRAAEADVVTGVEAGPINALAMYVKGAAIVIGLLLLLVAATTPDALRATRDTEGHGKRFDPSLSVRGEFYAFFLFSLTGVMLVGAAEDLAWLFLAIELTSLPTYVMIAISRDKLQAHESAVKYFFLGAMAAAMFLFGFTLLYGATGTTRLFGPTMGDGVTSIQQYLIDVSAGGGSAPLLFTAGMVLSIIGLAFKIAAVPMHFYAADVYEGAATPVTAFLAFVPKAAGFVALVLLLAPVTVLKTGDPAVEALTWTLWIIAALTMTVGNVLGLLQNSVKRMLAYSSIAHSGYMVVALVAFAGPTGEGTESMASAFGAVLFYLVAYGLGNLGAFAVLACLQRRGEDAQTFDDLAGLVKRAPGLAAIMLISVLSLIGLPPTVGFLGKVYMSSAAIDAGCVGLVVIALLNSAISAVYYLRLASVCFFREPTGDVTPTPDAARRSGAAIAAAAAVALGVVGGPLVTISGDVAAERAVAPRSTSQPNLVKPDDVDDAPPDAPDDTKTVDVNGEAQPVSNPVGDAGVDQLP